MSIAEQILGTWRLESYLVRPGGGGDGGGEGAEVVYPFGRDAVGLIMYTSDGFMSAQIMTSGRGDFDDSTPDGGSDQQLAAAAAGYLAYSGPFTVDEPAGVIHHRVDVSLLHNWIGGEQLRHHGRDGNLMVLSAENVRADGTTDVAELRWRRA